MTNSRQDLVSRVIARLPVSAPGRTVLHLIWDTWQSYSQHRGGETAAAIAYYSLFSIFPLILFAMSLMGFAVGSASRQEDIVRAIAAYIPGSEDLLASTVRQVLAIRAPLSIFSAIALLWSASGAFSLLAVAIERAWCVDCSRPIWKEKLVGVTLTLVVGILIVIAMTTSSLAQIIHTFGDYLFPAAIAGLLNQLDVVGFVLAVATNITAFFILYKSLPTLPVPWRAALLGATVAGLVWEIAKGIFAWYLATFAVRNFTLVYGSVGAVLALLLWTYFSAMIFLLGAELSATYGLTRLRSPSLTSTDGHE